MDLEVAFDNVRAACDLKAVMPEDANVTVEGGRMFARNAILVASQPVPGMPDFACSATALDYALRKLGPCNISTTPKKVKLEPLAGGKEHFIPLGLATAEPKKPSAKTTPIKDVEALVKTIEDVYPFTVGDTSKPWSMGARFDEKTLTATNGVMLCRADLPEPVGFKGLSLPRATLAYIIKRRVALKAWGETSKGILLEFEDGGWAHALRLNAQMPDSAVGLPEKAIDPAAWKHMQKISLEYALKFQSTIDMTEDVLEVYADKIYGVKLSAEHICELDTTLAEGVEKALFTAKTLIPVILNADEIGFSNYPNPVPFKTRLGSVGLLAGCSN